MKKALNIGLIGCGVIGERRLRVVQETQLGVNAWVFDVDKTRAEKLAGLFGAQVSQTGEELFGNGVDVLIVSTINGVLSEYAERGLHAGKHVLVEKPGAVSGSQMKALIHAQKTAGTCCKLGYNHRFHPAALQLEGVLKDDPILWIRAAYGHGGRPGYEKEWRFQKELSGGGEIIDQGVHLLDLVKWWGGDAWSFVAGARQSAFYSSTEEDNGFLLLRSPSGAYAHLHCSATQWKNLFRFEVATQSALHVWEGLGNANYGPERLTTYVRNPKGGAPTEKSETFETKGDASWEKEWRHFCQAIENPKERLWSSVEESGWIFGILDELQKQPVVGVLRGDV